MDMTIVYGVTMFTAIVLVLVAIILAVANAFVALMSPRAYRGGASVEEALNRLLEKAGFKPDYVEARAAESLAPGRHRSQPQGYLIQQPGSGTGVRL